MTERLSIMAAALLASERQHTRSFTIRRGDAIMRRDSIATRCGGVATTPRYGIGIMRYTSTVTTWRTPVGTMRYTSAGTMGYTSTVTIGHTPAVTTLCTPAATTLRDFAAILHGSDITTLRGFAACMVLTAPDGASHLSEMLRSVRKEVLLLELDAVIDKPLSVLVFECHTTMVLLLSGDVPNNLVFFVITLREAGVFFGPAVEKREVRVGLEPLAGRDFEFLDELGHRQGRRQRHEKMYMLGHTADTVEVASLVLNESMHIGVEFPLVFLHNGRDTSMGTKNNVIECLCVAHNFVFSSYYNFVYNVMITERIPNYCADPISPIHSRPTPSLGEAERTQCN